MEAKKKIPLGEMYRLLSESESKQRTGIYVLKFIKRYCDKKDDLKERWKFLAHCQKNWTRDDVTNGAIDIWFKEVMTLNKDALKFADMSKDINE